MRKILAISPDKTFLRAIQWCLQSAGYVVLLSESLEDSFLEAGQSEPFLVILDEQAFDPSTECEKFLEWFRHRSPVLLMTEEATPEPELHCDCCLPKDVSTVQLLSCVKNLQR